MHVNKRKFERNSSPVYHHVTNTGKTKHCKLKRNMGFHFIWKAILSHESEGLLSPYLWVFYLNSNRWPQHSLWNFLQSLLPSHHRLQRQSQSQVAQTNNTEPFCSQPQFLCCNDDGHGSHLLDLKCLPQLSVALLNTALIIEYKLTRNRGRFV